jgi:biofilm PGA synthesis N-glycosyltransferase PgaC
MAFISPIRHDPTPDDRDVRHDRQESSNPHHELEDLLDQEPTPALGGGGGMQRSFDPGPSWSPIRVVSTRYFSIHQKFAVACAFGGAWMAFSVWLSLPWIHDLAQVVHLVPAIVIVSLLAFLPGFIVAFLAASLLLDKQPPLSVLHPTSPLTVLIAARNEKEGIGETLRYLSIQDYDGALTVILADNGSTDATVQRARATAEEMGLDLRIATESRPGKSHALNRGLAEVTTDLVVTVDADTLLHRSALRLLVGRLESSPPNVNAVAGCVLVRNSRGGFWARLQEWDYFLGIASVKRMQGLFQTTLVAQGAFSLYRTDAVRKVGGWPDAIGEDIVLTWRLMQEGARVYYEPLSVAFTTAPERATHFMRQRARWARGMLEGLRTVPPWRQQRGFARVLTAIDLFIPLLDTAYCFVWIPGLVLAAFGIFWIIGPMTAAVLPLTLAVYGILYRYQRKQVFEPLGLRVRRNIFGLVLFVCVYQLIMSTVSVVGYAQQISGRRRRWK